MKHPLVSIFTIAKSQRGQVIWASFCSVINKLFDIAPEILIGIAIDVVVRRQDSFISQFGFTDPWEQILLLGGLTLLIWVGESTFEYFYMIAWRNLAQQIQHDFRIRTYEHMQNLDLNYFENQSTGNLVAILNDDVNQLEQFLNGGANTLIQTFTAVLGVGAVFFVISPSIAAVAFLPIPIVILGAFYFQRRALPLYAAVRSRVGNLSGRLNNNISGIVTIKSFTAEKREAQSLQADSADYMQANRKAIRISSAFVPIIRMAILAGFLATFLLGGWQVINDQLRVGSYGVLVFLTQRLLWPLTTLATTVDLYERAMASTRRILGLMQTPIPVKTGPLKPGRLRGDFLLQNLSFRYATGPMVLKGLNLKIEGKKTTAIVGSTGSGKSSLVKLLLRFYEPTAGRILLDDQPLDQYDFQALRSRVGLVSQDIFLFHGTVKENILYGKPTATDDEVTGAAKLAEAHDFIINLPDGYNTVIGERGQKLSGGQKQRVSIARAILKDPDVLILDEATSAVDNETEAAIQRSMKVIAKDRTTIVIAHRLSTVVNSDQIYVLEAGEVKEVGTHSQLLRSSGVYHSLWNVQTGQGS